VFRINGLRFHPVHRSLAHIGCMRKAAAPTPFEPLGLGKHNTNGKHNTDCFLQPSARLEQVALPNHLTLRRALCLHPCETSGRACFFLAVSKKDHYMGLRSMSQSAANLASGASPRMPRGGNPAHQPSAVAR